MSNQNNSGNNPPPQQNQIVWNGIVNVPQGQWITIPFPYAISSGNLPDLPDEIVEIIEKKSDGCTCKKCQEFFPYAEPNQKDGSLICYACRMTW